MSRARPSMYPTPTSASHWTALEACAQGLHACGGNLQGAVNVLEQGTFDLPRLAGIIQSRRMFDVVTEKDIFESQRALANEMAPEIEGYIARAEDGLEELKQRERALQSKLEKRSQAASRPQAPVSVAQSALDALEKELATLRNRKNRLGREVDLLEEKAARGGAAAGAGGPAARSRPGVKVGIGRR
ncbi:hypothetical protein BMF94_5264 [Rhodotorula taiwanensis]|uniref:DASH complex subunit SPC19 n=1 Tax=Rhodotorula taiwanensis TaxID=741276 RepID=A0A2S5B548_9BASI|nr:hypothetical protein BMF94_5264 [Rhodotorula taiwanensis]